MHATFTIFSQPTPAARHRSTPLIWLLISCLLFPTCLSTTLYGQTPGKDQPNGRKEAFFLRFESGKQPRVANAPQVLRQQLKLGANDQLVKTKTERDPKGFTHEQYEQHYKGIRVEYGVLKAHSRGGTIESITGQQYNIPEMGVQPILSESVALQRAMAFVGAKTYRWQNAEEEAWIKKEQHNPKATLYPKGELVICRDFLNSPTEQKMVLAYKFDIYATEPLSRAYIYVDATSGKVVHQNTHLMHANGTAETRYSGTRTFQTEQSGGNYVLRDASRGGGVETYNLQNGTNTATAIDFTDADNNWTALEHNNAKMDNVALDAHWGAQKVYDYWKNVHGRQGLDGLNGKIKGYVHYDVNYNNAFWDGEAIFYGDAGNQVTPMTSLDFVAHELGHGVMQHTADLIYQDESGALNEGFSDIWGAVIEHYAAPEKERWLIGEEVALAPSAGRSMSNPKDKGDADTYQGINWRTGTADNGGVHHNSGVLNHWFYILTEGKTGTNDNGTNYAVTGIGIDKAAQIAYRTESVYLTPTSNFQDTRVASLLAAIDLFSENSNEVIQTEKAWDAVGVGSPIALTLTVLSDTEVGLSWQVQYASITGFDVERSSSPDIGFAAVTQVSSNINSYNNTGLTVGTTYYYRIKATQANGFSYYSPVTGLVLGGPEPPALLSANVIGNTVNLSWQDNSSDEANFQVERSLSPTSGFAPLATLNPNTTSYQDNPAENIYYYRVRARNGVLINSLYSNVARAIVGNITVMSNTPVTTCDQLYLDPGGNGDYSNYQDYTQTFTPATQNFTIKVVFNAFQLENGNDVLYIYDGATTGAPLIGFYNATRSPGTVTATNPTGQLTFRFISNRTVVSPGWSATVSCQLKLLAAATSPTQVSLNWSDGPDETNFLIERSLLPTSGFTQIADLPANTTSYLDNVAGQNVYYYRYRTFRSDISSYSEYSNVARVIMGNITLMSNAPVTTCDQLYLDPGGNGDYPINQDIIQTFTPASPNSVLQVVFNSYSTEAGQDGIFVFDGANVNAPLIGVFSGNSLPPTITATNPTGQLTFRFISGSEVVNSGWSAHITCVPMPSAPDQQLSGNEDNLLAVTLAASYPAALTYNVLTLPQHGSLSGVAPNLTYTPEADFFGQDSLTYQVSANGFTSRTATVKLTINPVNDAPSFVKGADQAVAENAGQQTVNGWATSLSAGPANEAGQTLSFTVLAAQTGLFTGQPAISADGILTYTLAPNAFGSTTVSVTLSDNGGIANGGISQSSAQSFNITINAVNHPPVVANTIASQTATVGQSFSFAFAANTFSDPDGNTLTYAASLPDNTSLPTWLSFQANTRTFSGTPPGTSGSPFTIKVTASDGSLSVSTTFTLTVNPVPVGSQVVSFTLVNADNDQDIQMLANGATLNLASLPTRNLNIRANTTPTKVDKVVFNLSGKQTRTTTESGAPYALFGDKNGNYNAWVPALGSYSLKATPFLATAGAPLSIAFSVINQNSTNHPPVAAKLIPNQTATVSVPYSFSFAANTFSDPDGNALTYSASLSNNAPLPDWLSFNAGTRTFSGTPPNITGSPFTIRVTASDGSLPVSTSFTLTVNPAPTGPQVVSFTLVNADNDQDIQPLTDGAILNLASLPTRNLNIRATTSPAKVSSVVFNLSGKQTRNFTEGGAPYALFGDKNGDYYAWVPAVGSYSLKATPFSTAAGTALIITFRVINQAARLAVGEGTDVGMQLVAYPNPTTNGQVNVALSQEMIGEVSFVLVYQTGVLMTSGQQVLREPTSVLSFDFSGPMRAAGVYYLRLEGGHLKGMLKLQRQ